jgi:hypothetical protein
METAAHVESAFRGSGGNPFMASQTEAACLLESGALYTKRIMLRSISSDPIFAGVKQGAFSLYYGDAPIYHFDLDGRWQRAFLAGTHYLKGLDTTVQSIDRVREGPNLVLKRRTLSFAEAADLDAAIRSAALDLLDALGSGKFDQVPPPPRAKALDETETRALLEAIVQWDAERWFAHHEKYLETYGPLPIVPPDCQNAVILQATMGHAGGITFGLSRRAEYHARSSGEFDEHASAVRALFGQRLLQCKSIFLAGSDVLRRPTAEVLAYLETIGRVFPLERDGDVPQQEAGRTPRLNGIHAFLDDFAGPRPGIEALRVYAGKHLRRVSLGIESGDPELRGLFGKNWTDDDLRAWVTDLKAAGIGIGLMVLSGVGGEHDGERHLSKTAELLGSLQVGPGDLVSLLDASEVIDPLMLSPALEPGRVRMSSRECALQQAELRARLQTWRTGTGVKVAPYSLEKQAMSAG